MAGAEPTPTGGRPVGLAVPGTATYLPRRPERPGVHRKEDDAPAR